MISNPCQWFSGGSNFEDQKAFTYEGGTTLFHFSTDMVDDPEFSHYQFMNVVFFANDTQHAVDILVRMIEFYKDCNKKQAIYYGKGTGGDYYAEAGVRLYSTSNRVQIVLDHLNQGKSIPVPAPTNQLFKVGWADNDTIF